MKKVVRIDALPESAWRYAGYDAIVCVDVLLSSTTIVTALAQGRRVFAAPTPAHAMWFQSRVQDAMVVTDAPDHVDGEISYAGPSSLAATEGRARDVVHVSPFAEMLVAAVPRSVVHVACLRNIEATVAELAARHVRTAILGAGERGEVATEDQMAAAWLAARLRTHGFELDGHNTVNEVERWGHAGRRAHRLVAGGGAPAGPGARRGRGLRPVPLRRPRRRGHVRGRRGAQPRGRAAPRVRGRRRPADAGLGDGPPDVRPVAARSMAQPSAAASSAAAPQSLREMRRMAEAPLRRPWLVIVPLVLCIGAAVTASFLLPPRYKSSTLILVAPERMPSNLVPQMATDQTTRRLQTLRQEVHSRTRLEVVARDLDPYGTLGKEPLISTIERMRAAMTVSVKGNDAFTVEFEHSDPRMAMLVADRLTTLFMEEVAGGGSTRCRRRTSSSRPRSRTRAGSSSRRRRRCASSRRSTWGNSPSRCRPTSRPSSACSSSSRAWRTTCARPGRAPPARERRRGDGGRDRGRQPPPRRADLLRDLLTQLRTRYTDQHPDVKALLSRIVALEAAASAAHASAEPDEPPVDPVAAAAQRRLEEARQEVKELRARLADVDRRIGAFQARVEAAPRREQEIVSLTRDYQKLSENYTQLLSKKLEAEMAARLEQSGRASSSASSTRPTFPSAPASPTAACSRSPAPSPA